jgi:hypothetical protein
MTAATAERLANLAEVAPPVSVELKGLAAPIAVYELRGLAGRFAQRRPEAAAEAGVEVWLGVAASVVDDKRVRDEVLAGTVRRLGPRSLEIALEADLALLTNVRLRLTYAEPAHESGDLYGKVTGVVTRAGARLTRIHLTSVDAADQAVLAALVERGDAPGGPPVVSNAAEAPR